jgi:hypothetical protein
LIRVPEQPSAKRRDNAAERYGAESMVLGIVEALTTFVVLVTAAGMLLRWREGRRSQPGVVEPYLGEFVPPETEPQRRNRIALSRAFPKQF